jgi:ATP-dependent protease HslVU (ClpYQ) peptidase subunit
VVVERGAGKHGAWDGEVLPVSDDYVAIGSGAPYAYGALEVGASPIQAARAACKRDLMCAPPVKWEALPSL